MTDIQAIIDAMADTLNLALPGTQVYNTRPFSITTPAIIFSLGPIDYDSSLSRGSDEVQIDVNVFTTMGSDLGESQLYDYLKGSGPTSVKAILELDDTLGGVIQYLRISRARAPGIAQFGGPDQKYYGVAIECMIGVDGLD